MQMQTIASYLKVRGDGGELAGQLSFALQHLGHRLGRCVTGGPVRAGLATKQLVFHVWSEHLVRRSQVPAYPLHLVDQPSQQIDVSIQRGRVANGNEMPCDRRLFLAIAIDPPNALLESVRVER